MPIGNTQPECSLGCTDIHAENYDPNATEDNGSCFYVGCMDQSACNFSAQAMEDDGSCEYIYDCAGICGGNFIEDACANCYDPNALVEFETTTFNYTGAIETYTVPNGVTSLYIEVYGAQGGNSGGNLGGLGLSLIHI